MIRHLILLAFIASQPFAAARSADTPPNDAPRPVNDDVREALQQADLALRFQGSTPEECRAWQAEFRTTVLKLLGDPTPPTKWTVREEDRVEFDDHVRISVLLEADGVPAVPVHLLLPRKAENSGPAPAVVCIHGHGPFGHDVIVGRTDQAGMAESIAKANYDYGLQFVRRGYVVAAPCMIPFGRRVDPDKYGGNDPCAVTFVRMQALGQLPITANLRDLKWTIDYLQSLPEVDGERIGCAGLSYGGRMSMMLAAFDDRIKAAAVSGALNVMQERMSLRHSCGSQMIPGLLNIGDYPEIGSLIAPRPCVWETGSTDALIVPGWDDQFRSRLHRAYTALGADDQLQFDRFEGGHVWSGRIAFPLFDEVLKPERNK